MKNQKRIQIFLFIAVGIVTFSATSCQDEKPIIKEDPIITWSTPVDITVGTSLITTQLNATADISGTFVYTPPIGTSLSVGANQELKVDFTPTDITNYNTASKTVKLNVIPIFKKDPIITWSTPIDITVGTLLSAKQLNATADVAGTFVYTPPIGTSLSVGDNQDLKVDFTPTDVTNYNTASKTVKINVVAPLTVTDYDGNVYNTVTIGTQVWMKENLKTTHYADGTPITLANSYSQWNALTETSKAYCWPQDNIANKATYGAFYTWAAAMNGTVSASTNPSGVQGVCPTGWHLPSNAEYTALITYLGLPTYVGGQLKESGTSHWRTPNTSATNESGFTALPASSRNDSGTFGNLGISASWWTATEASATYAWYLSVNYNSIRESNDNSNKENGFCVRCLKD